MSVLSFVSLGTPYRVGSSLVVYPVSNPSTVVSRQALSYLVGQAVLIDGVARLVEGVESFCIAGEYPEGKPIGLAVKEGAS